MSISTYSELKTAIETWRARAGEARITANAADCVMLGETRLNRELPLRVFWINTTLTGVVDSRQLTLPSDFVEPEFLKLTSNSRFAKLRKRPAAAMNYFSASGEPTEWCINGANIDLNRPCASAYTFSFRYRQKLALSDGSPTNWLLTNHPDIYLAAVLLWSGLLIKDDDVTAWGALLRDGIEKLLTLDMEADGDVELESDPALLNAGYYDAASDTYL